MTRADRRVLAAYALALMLGAAVYLGFYTGHDGLAVVALVASAYAAVYLLAEADG
jgi:hypothetical protein